MNYELEKIRIQRNAINDSLKALDKREQEIRDHEIDASTINADEVLIKDCVSPDQVNYIMGQSYGYVSGFSAAVQVIIDALASEYRDIPMTDSELYMLVQLGEIKERAWLKDNKQKKILEANGWKQDFEDFYPYIWKKKQPEDGVTNED